LVKTCANIISWLVNLWGWGKGHRGYRCPEKLFPQKLGRDLGIGKFFPINFIPRFAFLIPARIFVEGYIAGNLWFSRMIGALFINFGWCDLRK
jgi:hypothetical protein